MPLWRKLQLAAGTLVALAVLAVLANTQLPGNTLARVAIGLGGAGALLMLAASFVRGATSEEPAEAKRTPAERPPAPVVTRVDSTARAGPGPAVEPVAPLLTGWIATREEHAATLEARIREHAALSEAEAPVTIEVILARRREGTLDAVFSGAPIYALVNLIGWLEASDSQIELQNGEILRLRPIPDDPLKDRIAGTSSTTDGVQVYLPEAELYRKGRGAAATRQEPATDEVARFSIEVDASEFCAGKGWPGSVVPELLTALERDPTPALETLFLPDEEQMQVSVDELEQHYEGRLVFATDEEQSSWLFVHPDGSWTEAALDGGILETFPGWPHLAVELWIRAAESPREPHELALMVEAFGLPEAAWLHDAFRPEPGEDHGAFRARFLALVLERLA